MDLSQLANVGEFVSGIAMLVTLLYLALQVRHGNQQSAATLQIDIANAFTDAHQSILEHPEHASLLLKLEGGEELSPVEDRQASAYVNRLINIWFGTQHAWDLRLVTSEFYATICDDVKRQASNPGFRHRAARVLAFYPQSERSSIMAPLREGRIS